MEEKERYELLSCWCITDNETNNIIDGYKNIIDLLNQQDKRIKELEEENLSLQEQSIRDNQNWIEETTKLKQQLHDLPKKIVEEIKKLSDTATLWSSEVYDYAITAKNLDTILKKYGEEK